MVANFFMEINLSLQQEALKVCYFLVLCFLLGQNTLLRKLLRALITTFTWKLVKGTRLIDEPNGNKIRDWTIRRLTF